MMSYVEISSVLEVELDPESDYEEDIAVDVATKFLPSTGDPLINIPQHPPSLLLHPEQTDRSVVTTPRRKNECQQHRKRRRFATRASAAMLPIF